MATERRSNCCNTKVIKNKDGADICAKCQALLLSENSHNVEVKATVKLGMQTK
jgi:hypothetical protein